MNLRPPNRLATWKGRGTVSSAPAKAIEIACAFLLFSVTAVVASAPLVQAAWYVDAITLFYPLIALSVVLVDLAAAIVLRSVRIVLVLAAGALLVVYSLPAFENSQPSPPGFASSGVLKVATLNCLKTNTSLNSQDLFYDWLKSEKPDVVALEEVPNTWISVLGRLHELYPYQARPLDFSMDDEDLISRYPIVSTNPMTIDGRSIVAVTITTPHGPLNVYVLHPQTIKSSSEWRQHNSYLKEFAEQFPGTRGNSLVLGDFNASPWSASYRGVMKRDHLHSQVDLLPPASRILYKTGGVTFGGRIDNMLTNQFNRITNCKIGSDVGSDHRPVICRLSVSDLY